MNAPKKDRREYGTLSPLSGNDGVSERRGNERSGSFGNLGDSETTNSGLFNSEYRSPNGLEIEDPNERSRTSKADSATNLNNVGQITIDDLPKETDSSSAVKIKDRKRRQQNDADLRSLSKDNWYIRKGHMMTFVCLYLFTVMVYFRPYETLPGLGFLSGTAVYFAVITLAFYIPLQLSTEGNLTILSTEVKAILALTFIAIVTIPIAKDPTTAWTIFNDPFIKAVLMFIVMVNVVRTRERLMTLMWLSFGMGIYLAYNAIEMYFEGRFTVEDYRVSVNTNNGMFSNPNEMALHFVMMGPIALTLGLANKGVWRLIYFCITVMFVAANMVTFSRGGFIGLLATAGLLAWKLGRRYRLKVSIASIIGGIIMIAAAPGNYGLRMLSIFVPSLDPVGSSDQRKDLLERSILVTARNPWGIGIGNFPLVGYFNLQSHNAFTQVSSELGILGLIAYLVFMISPYRKLSAIERQRFDENRSDWFYYVSIGLQVSIIGYMVSSFFASVAYNWFIYYGIAYAVAFRRVYAIENGLAKEVEAPSLWETAMPNAKA